VVNEHIDEGKKRSMSATIEQIEEAATWADGESDVMGDLRVPGTGPVAAVYDILRTEEKYAEDRD